MALAHKTIEKINHALENSLEPVITIFDEDTFAINYNVDNYTIEYNEYIESKDKLISTHISFNTIEKLYKLIQD